MVWLLLKCTDHSRPLLIAGLALGIGFPTLAATLVDWLPHMVVLLLVVTAFRVGRHDAFGALGDLRWSLPGVLVLQVGLPLVLAGILWLAGTLHTPLALALVLATSAPTITGGASLAVLLGQNPARVVQILILGTALFPLTVFLVLQVVPLLADSGALVEVGFRSLALILLSSAIGFALRERFLPAPSPVQVKALDGAAVLVFAVIVIGLMAAFGPAMRAEPATTLLWTLAAFGLSFGLQGLALVILAKGARTGVAAPFAIAAGNRNIALFLVALPPEVVAPILVFIACWQLPMYLTPVLLRGLYRRALSHD